MEALKSAKKNEFLLIIALCAGFASASPARPSQQEHPAQTTASPHDIDHVHEHGGFMQQSMHHAAAKEIGRAHV